MSDMYYAPPTGRYPNNPFDQQSLAIDMTTGKVMPVGEADPDKLGPNTSVVGKTNQEAFNFTQAPELSEAPEATQNNVVIIKGNLDPMTIMAMSRIPTDPERRIGAYIENGQTFVHVDALSIEKAYDYLTKEMAYNHRHAINMSDAGIQPYVASMLLDGNAKPPSLFDQSKEHKGCKVYRAIFLLTRGI